MSIRLQEVHDAVASYLGGGGSAFADNYLRAVKRVVIDINRQCFKELDLPTSVAQVYDLDENLYYAAFNDGVMHYMQMSGEWIRDKDPDSYRRYREALAHAQYHDAMERNPQPTTPWRE